MRIRDEFYIEGEKMIKDIYREMEKESGKKFPERKIVLGFGNENAAIMLIGEAPGAQEEKEGKPFVGSAGKNLDEFIERLEIKREDIFISNTVKIRPFKLSEKTGNKVNRAPNDEELEFFIPYLKREIEILKPKIIVTLGNTALRAVTGDKKAAIGDKHAEEIQIGKSVLFPLYHPASVIYNRKLKDTYYEDLDKLKERLRK